jgi:hypothetical protein
MASVSLESICFIFNFNSQGRRPSRAQAVSPTFRASLVQAG